MLDRRPFLSSSSLRTSSLKTSSVRRLGVDSPRVPRLGLLLSAIGLLVGLSGAAGAANHSVQAMPNNTFSPANLTIQAGDTVTWTNAGGFHNVEASDGSFRCANGCDGQGGDGAPASNAWSSTLTFNNLGTTNYVCIVHESVGMTGSITVTGGGDDPPGDLRLAAASQQRSEAGGSFSIQVQRVGGDDGAVGVSYATADGSASAGTDYTATSGTLSWPDGDDDARTITVPILNDSADENNETLTLMLSNPSGGAGLGSPSAATLTITDDDDPPTNQPGTLSFSSSSYSASEAGGSATIQVQRTAGTSGAVGVNFSTSDGSAESGSDYVTSSGTLTWADGDGSAKTFQIDLIDDLLQEGTETVNLSLSNATGGASLGTTAATLSLTDNDVDPDCVADADTLCLGLEGRFRAEIVWRVSGGQPQNGQSVDVGRRDSGLFYFFDENNIEMLLKVLDACGINQRFWVFYAATTDVEFELTVTDTLTGTQATYSNPLGNPAPPVLDTDAFATCP